MAEIRIAGRSLMGSAGKAFVDGVEVDPATGFPVPNIEDTPHLTAEQKAALAKQLAEDDERRRTGEWRVKLEKFPQHVIPAEVPLAVLEQRRKDLGIPRRALVTDNGEVGYWSGVNHYWSKLHAENEAQVERETTAARDAALERLALADAEFSQHLADIAKMEG